MENKVGNSHGVQIPKKSRSLDLKSLYKSKMSKDKAKEAQVKPVKRKSNSVYSAEEGSRKKRSKKQVSRFSSGTVNRNRKKTVAAVANGGPDSGLYEVEDIKNGVAGKSNTGVSDNGSSFSLDGNAIQIPKRKRGFVRRRKVEDSHEMKLPEHPGSIPGSSGQPAKSEEYVRDDCGTGNHIGCSQDLKEKAVSLVSPDHHLEVEAIPAQNDGLSLVKPRRKHRKSKNVEVARTEFVQVSDSAINNSLNTYSDMQEDDEENLEENAARMLSSRFDPSCTGTCSKGKSAQSSKCKTRVNNRHSRCRSRSPAVSDTVSPDAADRILRPRKETKEKGLLRKRRHFYEISAEKLDALWVLNKRIKVFWPLDEKWYFGLVNDYDEERKLHHIKYDDRDEEWINLHNERFKLLLLRGEVTGKAGQERVVSMEKHPHYRKGATRNRKEDRKRNVNWADDSSVMDSEPIISWLARSLSSTSHAVKKQKSSLKMLHSMSSTCYDDTTNLQVDSLKRVEGKLHSGPVSVDKSVCSTENDPTKQGTRPIVYVRRNSRKTGDSLPREAEDDSVYAYVLKREHISLVADGACNYDISCEKSQHSWPLWSCDESSFLDQIATALTDSGVCKLKLCISVSSILNYSLAAGNCQLFHALLLLQYGVLMIMWPMVHLEMLFVDSVVGLRFLLFEGSLKDALAFTFMVLAILTPSSDEEKNVNLQSPATSTSFKFVSVQGCRKQLVFGVNNFIALENSKWAYLDMKLRNHCLLTKQLPLSECTYENMKAFHVGAKTSLESCQYGVLSKGFTKKHKLGLAQGKSGVSSGYFPHEQCNSKTEPLCNGFVNGPKKPRTQVSYSMPSVGFDSKNRGSLQKTVPHKRIRRSNEKKSADISAVSQRNFDLLCCNANVLITHGDRGWRECGAKVLLELADQNEWKLAVRVSGNTRYSYKAHQFLQPGSTNRYTHAMMWKGGKDWLLEFPDRSQWSFFKEMYDECHNRNIRAALVKTIPIPGVRLVDDNDDSGPEVAFVRGTSKYFRQLETDVEMALNPSRILYDMDSEDEKWIHANRSSLDVENHIFQELSGELFERTIDRLEKASYAQNRDQFTAEEMQEFMDGVGSSIELIKAIHGYWRQKREKKGVPLIRHFQSPQWERYKKQVKDWEVAVNNNKGKNSVAEGCQNGTTSEKPSIFAFCMKPRGLEVPNKGSKQRSHKKISIAVHNSCVLGEQDGGLHAAYGRRSNGFGDERQGGQYYESMEEVSPLFQSSSRLYSPSQRYSSQDMTSDRYYYPRTQRNNNSRFGTLESSSPHSSSTRMRYATTSTYNSPRASTTLRSVSGGGSYYPDWQSNLRRRRKHDFEEQQLETGEMDEECILRDASGAAKHARKLAKLKKERAHRLFFRANMAIHKAVSALMTAEAMKPSSCSTPSSSSPSSLHSASSFSSSSSSEEDVSGGDH